MIVMNKMTTNINLTIKDKVQHAFSRVLGEVKTDKYILISEKTDLTDELWDLRDEPSFSCGFYTELKDVLIYAIEKVRKNVYVGHEDSIDEWFRISKNFLEYSIAVENECAEVYVYVYNIKDSDEKIIRETFKKLDVKEIS